MSKNICVVGGGYVGLVTSACLAEVGHSVVCVDSDQNKIKTLKMGQIPIHEPGLSELVAKNRERGNLSFSDSIASGMNCPGGPAEVVFIAVGTPPRADGSADLTSVEAVAREVAKNLKGYTVVVDKSTVPVKTGEWVFKTIQRFNKSGHDCDVASNPEFLAEGTAVNDFLHPDRIVFGVASKRAEDVMRAVYAPIPGPVLVTDIESAELIKHASNSFLATKISFINAVSILCEKVGADVSLVAQGMGLDKRIGPSFLKAGIGFGGFCFPKDLEAFRWISKQCGYDFDLLRNVQEINEFQKEWVLRKLEKELWNLEGKTVAILGLSFKPHTDDLRFAPSLEIIEKLIQRQVKVRACDPVAGSKAESLKGRIHLAKDAYDASIGADAVVLVTEWPEYRELNFGKLREIVHQPVFLDGRNVYDPAFVRREGFVYYGVGRGTRLTERSGKEAICAYS